MTKSGIKLKHFAQKNKHLLKPLCFDGLINFSDQTEVPNYTLLKGSWVHISLAAERNNIKFYIDGIEHLSWSITEVPRANMIDNMDTLEVNGGKY